MTKHILLFNSDRVELRPGNQVLGRGSDNAISIPEPSLSSKHLLISNFSEHIEVVDINSSNGTFINNQRIPPMNSIRLKNCDRLLLGKLTIEYKIENEAQNQVQDTLKKFPAEFTDLNIRKDVTIFAKFDPKQFMAASENAVKEDKDLALVQQTSKRLGFLYSFGQKIGSILDIRELFRYIIGDIFDLFIEADRALIFLIKDGNMQPEIFMKNGIEHPIEEAKYSKTIVSMATDEKHGFIASDLSSGQDIDRTKSIVLLNLQCTMIVPFIVDNEIYGLLQLDSTKKINAFSEDDLKMLSGISNQVAINIKNKLLIDEMNSQAKVKNSLERYLGPKMVNHLIDNKINLDQKGEERFVTVLFSDIRGFTNMSEKLKPTQIIEILTIYFSEMTDIIFKFDGFIDKFIGDAIFSIFGIPLYQEDHTDCALQSAIEMQRILIRLNDEVFAPLGIKVNVGIGINTGNVVYGNIASMERPEVTVLGDTVNISSRLCSLAGGGEIYISEGVRQNLKGQYNMENLGATSLKGKEEKVTIYSVKID